ncbi:MAG TPA: hypothetical protein VEF89_16300 [Solirubrobacteraceae bacterium]|nr:hypothetical protein [Solirubrobacteraceae bacterium]
MVIKKEAITLGSVRYALTAGRRATIEVQADAGQTPGARHCRGP